MSELEFLLSKTRYRKYRESKADPKKVLEWIHKEVTRKHSWRKAWDILVELLADKLRPREIKATAKYFGEGKGFSFLPETKHKDLAKKVSEQLDHYIIAAQKDPWDHLGMILEEQGLNDRKYRGQVLTPKGIVQFMTEATFCYDKKDKKGWKKPKTCLDPCVGTGRFLIYPSIKYPSHKTHPMILFGVEIDLSLYRACIVNLSLLSKHPYGILCANTLRLDPDLTGPSSIVWLTHANRWNPPDITPYYWKPPPPPPISKTKFSLSHWSKQTQTQ